MEQTPVEWLQEQLKKVEYNPLEKNGYSKAEERLFERAKEIEKENRDRLLESHLNMIQLLESLEVILQNGNSINPDSVIRGAIQQTIGMDINLKTNKSE